MTDLSKIDFTRLTLPDWGGIAVTVSTGSHGVELRRGHGRFANLLGDVWQYARAAWNELVVAKTYTDHVDRFLAEETARLAAEDEAANFVSVPWQDVEWLENQRVEVYEFHDEHREFVRCGQFRSCATRYHADKRTLPTSYDPTKPRWVEVDWENCHRLELAGCKTSYWSDSGREWRARLGPYQGSKSARYAVDIHTLKPGVPLHVDPPKPEPRPCTREFALAHPGESEFHFREKGVTGWSTWLPMSDFLGGTVIYEFRTTAREPERRKVTVEFDGKRWAGELVEQ